MNINYQACLVPWNRHGVQFWYPDIWDISEQTDGGDMMITVTGSETCFWTLRILPGCPPPPQVIESCIAAFREEYDDVEVAQTETTLAEMPAVSRQLDFFCLELMNSVGLRSVRTSEFTLLVWWQGTQQDLDEFRPVFDHMSDSIRAECLRDQTAEPN